MQKRHTPAPPVQVLSVAALTLYAGPHLTPAKLRRVEKLRKELEALKEELAQVLGIASGGSS